MEFNKAGQTEPLLKRVFMFLEDSDWNSADNYCEKVLDIDPENAEAYLGKLMAELHVNSEEALAEQMVDFSENANFKKALRFANEESRETLLSYSNTVKAAIYTKACMAMRSANEERQFRQIAAAFDSIVSYKDAATLSQDCLKKAEHLAKTKAKRNKKIATIGILLTCVVAAVIVLVSTVIIPNVKYSEAIELMNAGEYTEAIAQFTALGDYKDSAKLTAYASMARFREKLAACKVGDIVTFGTYEQDNNTANGKEDIEWKVLSVEDNRVLVISKYVLDCQPYHFLRTDITWENCTLRKWLNNEFINEAFGAEVQALLTSTIVPADINPEYDTDPGYATLDKVFLLSILEAYIYFDSGRAMQCEATEYAKAQGMFVSKESGTVFWWLRSPGINPWSAASYQPAGMVGEGGAFVDEDNHGVRPAMWIALGS